jgi:uncharacterized cupin superfamily protein
MASVIVKKPSEEEKAGMIADPVWEHDVASFPWKYDEREVCLFLEGDVTVICPDGEYRFGAGDLVEFEAGLSCEWIIHKKVRKHYRFV